MKSKIIKWFKTYKKWIISALFIILFLIFVESLLNEKLFYIDDYIYHYISKLISPSFTLFFKIITNLGSATILILITLLTLLIFKNKRYGIFMSLNLIIVALLNQTLKAFFERPRPFDLMIIDESGYSFPSGHSMASMAFYGFIIFLIWKYCKNNTIKWLSTTILSILIILIGISRIYLGVHYASDVIAGFCISVAYLIIFTAAIDKKLDKVK